MEEEEESYGVSRDAFSVNPEQMDPQFKEELKEIVYCDLPEDTDYAVRLAEERVVMFDNEHVRGEVMTRGYSPHFPPLTTTRMQTIGAKFAVAIEYSHDVLEIDKQRAEDQHVFEQRLKKMTLRIQVDNLIRELVSRIRMELYMFPGEADCIREQMKMASEHRATLPEEVTLEEQAQTQSYIFHANQLLGKPSPPEKGCERPVLIKVYQVPKTGMFNPKLSKTTQTFPDVPEDNGEKRVAWVACVDRGTPFWNAFPHLKFERVDVGGDALVTLRHSGNQWTCTWHQMIHFSQRKNGRLNVLRTITITDEKRVLGPCLGFRAFPQGALAWFTGGHLVAFREEQVTIHRYSGIISAAACIGPSVIVVGTEDGYIVHGNTTIDMPYRVPIQRLEDQGGGILLASTRMAVYRFHPNPEIGPYQLNVPCAMGVSGCGALVASVSMTGNTWISNTFAKQHLARSINPPPGIAKEVDLTKEKDKKDKEKHETFLRLDYPFQYQYNAIWIGRLDVHILYPDGSIRRLVFKPEKK